jgi:DivIVA domain-containing protein
MLYEQPPISSPFESGTGKGMLRPEDVTSHDLPVAMRGYDKEQVERFLHRVSEAYLLTWRQALALRERLRSLEDEIAATQGEAEASGKSVAELIQRCSTAEDQLTAAREARIELSAKLDLSERERKQALTNLREASERASDLENRLQEAGNGQQGSQAGAEGVAQPAVVEGEAAALLVAAARAADDVREASRGRALRTLTEARNRAMKLHDEAERERVALAEMLERRERAEHETNEILAGLQERRERAEHEANEILVSARAEAERVIPAIEDERRRVRELLAGALQSLDAEDTTPPNGLMADLSSRLQEPTAADDT